MDHTIVNGSTGFFYMRRMVTRGWLSRRHIAFAAYYMGRHATGTLAAERVAREGLEGLAGLDHEELMELAHECFELDIRPRIYPQAREAAAREQQAGRALVLVSAGPPGIIRLIGQELGAADSLVTDLELARGKLSGRMIPPMTYGEGKVTAARMSLRRFGCAFGDCSFYADSISDSPLLQQVGAPFCINPDVRLRRAAAARSWPVMRW
ncbi:MAG: Phosphoserine phosphatase SerB1 [Myxococcota bacterium]|nr:Phosphoserine phosphatase SerB1 [Myxococcota bacterium]